MDSTPGTKGGKENATEIQLFQIRSEAQLALTTAAEKMKQQFDKKKKSPTTYEISDQVWLDRTNLTITHPIKKLHAKWFRPFTNLPKKGQASYELHLPSLWKAKYPIFHADKLLLYYPPLFPSEQKPSVPLSELINEEEEYEIDQILDSQMSNNTLQYLVFFFFF